MLQGVQALLAEIAKRLAILLKSFTAVLKLETNLRLKLKF